MAMDTNSLFFLVFSFGTLSINAYEIPDGYMQYEHGCAWSPAPNYNPKQVIITTVPYSQLNAAIPTNFSWLTAGPSNSSLVTPVRNQMLPNPCGSCWAIASVGALSDRLKISTYKRSGNIPTDINLAPQYVLDLCFYNSKYECGSCNGGSANLAHSVIHQTSISDESCAPYLGQEVSFWAETTPTKYICRKVDWFTGDMFLAPPNPMMNFSISEYGALNWKNFAPNNTKTNVTMVDAMMQEIFERGPIACSMYAHAQSFQNYTGGILVDREKYKGTTHLLSLIGFGVRESDGLKFWIGRNSFGTVWGENGFFRAERGVNIYNMEQSCDWATIKYPKDFF